MAEVEGKAINVYFPFLDAHPDHKEPFRTNARLDETFDQIGLFSRDRRLPLIKEGKLMGKNQREQLDKIDPGERGEIMQIVTSWMEQGLQQGLQQGLEQGREREVALILRILSSQLGGTVSTDLASVISTLSFEQLDELGIALPGFTSEADLRTWLQSRRLC